MAQAIYTSSARIEVWRATDTAGFDYELDYVREFTKKEPTTLSMVISSPRNGSTQDNRIDCMFPQ